MRFQPLELTEPQAAFADEVNDYLDRIVTPEVHDDERRFGNGHSWSVHHALGARGWLYPMWPLEHGGAGLGAVEARILAEALFARSVPGRGHGTTSMVMSALLEHGDPELVAVVRPRVARGEITMCLGWTEPESGSDVAATACQAVKVDGGWQVTGQKLFSSGADFASYAFLLARSDPGKAKRQGLSMLLVPLDADGVEIQAVRTIGGERTNIVYYNDVFVPDLNLVGERDGGWTVLASPLNHEHGIGRDISMGQVGGYHHHLRRALHETLDLVRADHDGDLPATVQARLARVALACIVAGEAPPGPPMRVLGAESLVRHGGELMDLLGQRAVLTPDATGAPGGLTEYAFRVGPETTIYGGTTDIARSLIAESTLKLPRSRGN